MSPVTTSNPWECECCVIGHARLSAGLAVAQRGASGYANGTNVVQAYGEILTSMGLDLADYAGYARVFRLKEVDLDGNWRETTATHIGPIMVTHPSLIDVDSFYDDRDYNSSIPDYDAFEFEVSEWIGEAAMLQWVRQRAEGYWVSVTANGYQVGIPGADATTEAEAAVLLEPLLGIGDALGEVEPPQAWQPQGDVFLPEYGNWLAGEYVEDGYASAVTAAVTPFHVVGADASGPEYPIPGLFLPAAVLFSEGLDPPLPITDTTETEETYSLPWSEASVAFALHPLSDPAAWTLLAGTTDSWKAAEAKEVHGDLWPLFPHSDF